jgi:hypothetical protein
MEVVVAVQSGSLVHLLHGDWRISLKKICAISVSCLVQYPLEGGPEKDSAAIIHKRNVKYLPIRPNLLFVAVLLVNKFYEVAFRVRFEHVIRNASAIPHSLLSNSTTNALIKSARLLMPDG